MELNQKAYWVCELCPRRCGVDRTEGQQGFCGMAAHPVAARAAGHYWEEPVISGEYGSGAVFFSGCTLRCKFCQNYEISTLRHGFALDSSRLREIFEALIAAGHHNINLVTPTHFLPDILPALEPKLPVPVVYNCGGYERVETLRALEGKIDVWLPDLKYSDDTLAGLLSAAPDYVETAKEDAPGYRIYIKDSAPLNRSDAEACAYVGTSPDKLKEAKTRTARFRTVIALVQGDKEILFEGIVEGKILPQPIGEGGFGYDPIFAPIEANGLAFAQMSAEAKNAISHRGRATKKLAEYLCQHNKY